MDCILISGFEPFDGAPHNSSQDLVEALDGKTLQNAVLRSCVLPVVCDDAWFLLREHIEMYNPISVIAFGQSKRTGIHLEQYAYNRNHFRIPDNMGNQPQDSEIVRGGRPSLPSSLPIESLISHQKEGGTRVVVSTDPGRFVCNNLFYHMQLYTKDKILSGFVHLPFACSDVLIHDAQALLVHIAKMVSTDLS